MLGLAAGLERGEQAYPVAVPVTDTIAAEAGPGGRRDGGAGVVVPGPIRSRPPGAWPDRRR